MNPDRPLAIQLSTFFEKTAPESVLGYLSENHYEKDRKLYAIGNPFGLHLKFYDYSDTSRIGGVNPNPDKSQHLNWTLKKYLDHATKTPPNLTPDQTRRIFIESLVTIFGIQHLILVRLY